MAAEYDDLPEAVKKEVQQFTDVNVAWLSKVLRAAALVSSDDSERRAPSHLCRHRWGAVGGEKSLGYRALRHDYRELSNGRTATNIDGCRHWIPAAVPPFPIPTSGSRGQRIPKSVSAFQHEDILRTAVQHVVMR